MKDSKKEQSVSRDRAGLIAGTAAFFTSVRTTIALLFILAGASVLGTLIPQQTPAEELGRSVSAFYLRLILILDLNDLYHSWWFMLLLAVLAVNLLACLVQRTPAILSDWKDSRPKKTFSFNLSDPRPGDRVKPIVVSAVSPILRSSFTESVSDGVATMSWVKHKLHLLAFPMIHIGIATILLGGLIGLLYGYRGYVLIKEGEASSEFVLRPSGETKSLPFSIALDAFSLTRYPSGEPKEFRSDVRLLQDGAEAVKAPILVNHPLTLHGISLYQSDYRVSGLKDVTLSVATGGGQKRDLVIESRKSLKLSDGGPEIGILDVDPGSSRRGAGVELSITVPGGTPQRIVLYEKDPVPTRVGEWEIGFAGYRPMYSSGLQIGYDPGTVFVWGGSGLLIFGFLLALFTNHRRLTVELDSRGGKTVLAVSGSSRRMRSEYRKQVEEALRDALQGSKKTTS